MTRPRHSLARRAAATVRVAARTRIERSVPYRSPEAIERLQQRRLRAIVTHAYEAVPFYREQMRRKGLRPTDIGSARDLLRLPLIDAELVRSDPERFASEAVPSEERETAFSSGTDSALPGAVYWDRGTVLRELITAERDRGVITRMAGEGRLSAFGRELVGPRWRRLPFAGDANGDSSHRRISFFPNDMNSRTMRRIWAGYTLIPARSAHHHFFSPTLPLDEAAAHIGELRPRVVFSFGSFADQFLRYLEHGGIELDLPRVWVYGGDMASEEASEIAQRRGLRLFSVYSAVETGRLGFQCEQGAGHHLNVDLTAVRIADDSGVDVPAGREGDILVSNLTNRATVLLNYRLGDRGTLASKRCPCGRGLPLLQELRGRRSDLVRMANGREVALLVVKGLFRAQLKRVLQAQLVQEGEGQLRWRIVPAPGTDPEGLERSFRSRALEVLADTRLEVEMTPSIGRTPRGKFQELVRA